MAYEIRNGPEHEADFTFYGGAREAVACRDSEWMLHGPAETGKTISILTFLHIVACKYPKASIVILRKTQTSVYTTVIKTFREKVINDQAPVFVYGGERPSFFRYDNDSTIHVAGMDKSSRILSAEHDIIFWNQAEEGEEEEWEICTTRTTGRAGNMPYGQTIGDMNPTYPTHWPYHRKTLQLFYSKHQDNPTLYDPVTGDLTDQGHRTMSVLGNLTGARRTRLLEGKAAQVEGAILTEWADHQHLKDLREYPKFMRYVAGVDWGYKNPGCIGIWGIDGRNGAAWLVSQIYYTGRVDDWWIERALELHMDYSKMVVVPGGKKRQHLIEAWICDPSEPAYIQKFKDAGLNAIGAFNSWRPGIDAVKSRLQHDGLFIGRDSLIMVDPELDAKHQPLCVQDEIPGYVWANKAEKEMPLKERDHGIDMTRYVVSYLDGLGREPVKKAGTWSRRVPKRHSQ
jgi:phage terminase large subunit